MTDRALDRAVELFARVRREGDWESAQTHSSLLPYLVEETWELVDCVSAPGGPDRDELVSELGDLLLQVLFHSAIGAEREDRPFDVDDVARSMLDKLRRRAPYWFTPEGTEGLDAVEQDRLWQEAKRAERATRGTRERGSVLDGVSWAQPALALGQKVLTKAAAAGVPDDLIPDDLRVVTVAPAGLFDDETASPEIAYRSALRRFADRLREAEARLDTVPATSAQWHRAWPTSR